MKLHIGFNVDVRDKEFTSLFVRTPVLYLTHLIILEFARSTKHQESYSLIMRSKLIIIIPIKKNAKKLLFHQKLINILQQPRWNIKIVATFISIHITTIITST